MTISFSITHGDGTKVILQGQVCGDGAAGAIVTFYGVVDVSGSADENGGFSSKSLLTGLGDITGYACTGSVGGPVRHGDSIVRPANHQPELRAHRRRTVGVRRRRQARFA